MSGLYLTAAFDYGDNVAQQRMPKTSPADFWQDLELFRDMVAAMRS